MRIDPNIFVSAELRGWASFIAEAGHCDLTGKDCKVIDDSELWNFFSQLFSFLQPTPKGKPLFSLLQNDWNLFCDGKIGERCIESMLRNKPDSELHSDTLVEYNGEATAPCKRWRKIEQELKTSRHFFAGKLLDDDDQWDTFFASNNLLNKNDFLYRGRINEKNGKVYSEAKELGAPPASLATAGRVNVYGIPHLYMSTDKDTVMYECRALAGDRISVAKYRVRKRLDVLDFTFRPDLFKEYQGNTLDMVSPVQRYLLLKEVGKEMSKPIRRYDTKELDYLPTQFVSEYIRLVTGARGMVYESSQNSGGKNVVLFNPSDVEFVGVEHLVIGKMKLEYEE